VDNKDKISDTFLALNYLNLSKNYSRSKLKSKLNINMVWDVYLNPLKYQNQINEFLKNKVFSDAYFLILKNEGCIYQEKLNAASNERIFSRSSNEFKIEIVKSNKNEDVYYLIIKIINDMDLQLSNLYVICDNESDCIKLPILNDKQAQILIKKSDNFFNLITNPNAEIFIR
tara:strand:- start:27 stop:542 length:516 start_codon:yes stop_codon:yes gene_type:complete